MNYIAVIGPGEVYLPLFVRSFILGCGETLTLLAPKSVKVSLARVLQCAIPH